MLNILSCLVRDILRYSCFLSGCPLTTARAIPLHALPLPLPLPLRLPLPLFDDAVYHLLHLQHSLPYIPLRFH